MKGTQAFKFLAGTQDPVHKKERVQRPRFCAVPKEQRCRKMANAGLQPATFALLARRCNQLS
jgi:hypothetical protein